MNFIIYRNSEVEDEKALVDRNTREIVLKGDSYHDKIDSKIEGFLLGVEYVLGESPLLEKETVKRDSPMFRWLRFSHIN